MLKTLTQLIWETIYVAFTTKLLVKECEDAEKKAEEGKVIKQRRPSEPCQMTLVELKEQRTMEL